MILTGRQIAECVSAGSIMIEPFSLDQLNPNSYNYRLGDEILECHDSVLDPISTGRDSWTRRHIPKDGIVLSAGRLYLGNTMELIGSTDYVPSLIGRSSMGRLGVYLQVSADLGNLGSIHRWTLEIVVVQPTRLYAGMRIGQVSFWRPEGARVPYSGYFGSYSAPTTTPEGYNL